MSSSLNERKSNTVRYLKKTEHLLRFSFVHLSRKHMTSFFHFKNAILFSRRSAIAFQLAIIFTLTLCLALPTIGEQKLTAAPATPSWVEQSNQNAQVLIQAIARFAPEGAGQMGVEGLDEQILDLKPGFVDRQKQTARESIATLQGRLPKTTDPKIRQDLEILIGAAQDTLHGIELGEKYELPYVKVSEIAFGGLQALLDDQVPPERRAKALVRLKRYAGMENGYTPLTSLAEQYTRAKLQQQGRLGPIRAEVEKDLTTTPLLIIGISKLFEKYQIQGYQQAYNKLVEQLTDYDTFVRQEILPKSRTDFRQPPELYAFALKRVGVDIPPAELAKTAHTAFDRIQQKMQELAPQVAKQRGFKTTNYREVISLLKREQLEGKAILPHYEQRIKEIESIIQREKLVTLPKRSMRFRLASEAESARLPAPYFQAPRLLGNTGQMGEFILPLRVPSTDKTKPNETKQLDDFTYPAMSWTLTAHEGRPGHELQFSSMIEGGVSAARAIFAANSANIEGWGLYAESILRPYMPLDGQLISLQFQLLRAARAFLDPELQAGKITPQQALKILTEQVMFSDAFSTQEVERYTFRMPGQATSYFYGYTRLLEVRSQAEKKLGKKFNPQQFHDFILSQGLLPPPLLQKAVQESFVR
jgi:Bacterial protein of unknown function (DUF885)